MRITLTTTVALTLALGLSTLGYSQSHQPETTGDAANQGVEEIMELDSILDSELEGNEGESGVAPHAPTWKLELSGTHEVALHAPVYSEALNYNGEMKSPAARNLLGLVVQDRSFKLVSK